MRISLLVIIFWNTVDLMGKLISHISDSENIITGLGSFIDATIYSVSIIVLALVALKLISNRAS
jgi:hypothetical protein